MGADADEVLGRGDVVAGKYRIIMRIGAGGAGVVYRAQHLRIGSTVAIKVITRDISAPQVAARFEREARAAGLLKSLHSVRIHDADLLPTGAPFLVMEYLEGHDLATEAAERDIPPSELLAWIVQACGALAEAHEHGIIHRDIKPANLFLAELENTRITKVLDFGVAMLRDDGRRITGDGLAVGTPQYMAPEQLRAAPDVDGRADVYSLAAVTYRMLAKRLPVDVKDVFAYASGLLAPPPSLDVLRPDLPRAVCELVMRGLSRERDARPSLDAFSAGLAPHAVARGVPQLELTVRMKRPTDPPITLVPPTVGGGAEPTLDGDTERPPCEIVSNEEPTPEEAMPTTRPSENLVVEDESESTEPQ